ncbi:MAG: arsenate reductase (glutaredoxin) [Castellaniella sp.]
MTTIYHNPRCSTSRAALARLQEAGHTPEIVLYLEAPLDEAALASLIHRAGLSVAQALRSKESLYSELGLDGPDVSDAERLAAVAAHPILLNRPFVVTEKGVRLARPLSAIDEIL